METKTRLFARGSGEKKSFFFWNQDKRITSTEKLYSGGSKPILVMFPVPQVLGANGNILEPPIEMLFSLAVFLSQPPLAVFLTNR